MFTFTLLSSILLLAVNSIHASTFAGEGTYYDPGQNQGIGACGYRNVSAQYVAAIGYQAFDSYPGAGPDPNTNGICGQVIQVNYEGKSVVLEVVDRCASCNLAYDVDMTETAFSQLADPTIGRLKNPGITWTYVPKDTQLGCTSSPPPSPPPDTPLPPARRSLDGTEQWKRTPEQNDPAPPHVRRMIKRRATAEKSDTLGERGSVEPRHHSPKTNENPVPDPVRRDVPQGDDITVTKRVVEEQDRKPPSPRTTPLQSPPVGRRMIKVARFSR